MSNIEGQPYSLGLSNSGVASVTSFSWGGLLGTLLVVILLLIITLWIIKRLNISAARGLNSPWVRVLDRQVLGGRQILYLVEIAGRLQVLCGSDYHLIKISEIDNPDVAAEILDEISNTSLPQIEGGLVRLMSKASQKKRKSRRKRKGQDAFSIELERLLREVEK
ncbi:MAG TPA: flagellar biosynthetic protein FliO [Desulfitobacteriaceae bacterium]|nr:flagellar biosynthetic protein FliO [Desulfitobacteriaceae bacterium]